jgi:hypothetical protein
VQVLHALQDLPDDMCSIHLCVVALLSYPGAAAAAAAAAATICTATQQATADTGSIVLNTMQNILQSLLHHGATQMFAGAANPKAHRLRCTLLQEHCSGFAAAR